jgi:hypothetical protein
MNIAAQPAKAHNLDSTKANSSLQNAPFFPRFWNNVTQGIGTGYRKPANYDSMSKKELEEKAAQDMAICKTMGL